MQVVYWRGLSGPAPVRRQDRAEEEGELQGSCHRGFNQSHRSSKGGCLRLSQLRDCVFVPPQLSSYWIWAAPKERL